MFSSLTIFKKGLLLIAIPFLAQAVFIGLLVKAQAESEFAQSWAVHTKDVIAKVDLIYRTLLEVDARIRNRVVSGDPPAWQGWRPGPDRIKGDVAELRALVASNR